MQPTDEDFKPYRFSIKSFMELIGVETKSKYSVIPKITKGLMQKVFEIKQDNKVIQLAWLSSVEYNKGTGVVELEFSPKLKPFMLGLKEFYTTYKLKNVLELKGKYSIRLYEILKSYEYKKFSVIELDELKEILKANTATYLIYQNFKSRIMEPAKRELKQKTDIWFEYEEIKTGKKITAIKFMIYSNNLQKERLSIESSKKTTEEPAMILIQEIKKQFKDLYQGNLMDKFIISMLENKGIEHIRECLNTYNQYIKGRNISNIAGDFYTFVMDGYEKPVHYSGNVPQHANFEQRQYDDDYYEKFYYNIK